MVEWFDIFWFSFSEYTFNNFALIPFAIYFASVTIELGVHIKQHKFYVNVIPFFCGVNFRNEKKIPEDICWIWQHSVNGKLNGTGPVNRIVNGSYTSPPIPHGTCVLLNMYYYMSMSMSLSMAKKLKRMTFAVIKRNVYVISTQA